MLLKLSHSKVTFIMVVSCCLLTCTKAQDDDDNDMENDYSQPGEATKDCLCVPFTQCEEGEIVTDGRFVINPRRKATETPLENPYPPPACGPYHTCCRNPEASTVTPYVHHCGTRNPGGINHNILAADTKKEEAEFGEWPWQAAILRKEGPQFVFQCGGTLIDQYHILTVAHCAKQFEENPSRIIVRLGEWDTQNDTEFMPHEDYEVSEVTIHPKYVAINLHNDIAVVRLADPVTFKPHIDTVCLPKREDDFTDNICVVTGWGTNAFATDQYSLILKEVSMPVLSHADCQSRLRTTKLGKYFKLHKNFLCAGGEKDIDVCQGDGGGPLVCFKDDNTYTLAGLVAWGIGCFSDNIPGVYVDVKKFVDWITSVTGETEASYWSESN